MAQHKRANAHPLVLAHHGMAIFHHRVEEKGGGIVSRPAQGIGRKWFHALFRTDTTGGFQRVPALAAIVHPFRIVKGEFLTDFTDTRIVVCLAEPAASIDDADLQQFGHQVDHTRPTDSSWRGISHRGQLRLKCVRIDGHFFDGPAFGAHAPSDAAALECRTDAAGSRHHPLPVAQDDFAIGADVDEH